MSKVIEFVFISLGVGTVVSLIRYLAVWYIVRRMRRNFPRWRRWHNKERVQP